MAASRLKVDDDVRGAEVMSDDHDDGLPHFPPMPDMKKQTTDMTSAMMEMMAPMMAGAQFLQDEARAWDGFYNGFLKKIVGPTYDDKISDPRDLAMKAVGEVHDLVVKAADMALKARRERFNLNSMGEGLRSLLPSAMDQCGKSIIKNDGSDSGYKCTRNAGHPPPCY